MDAFEISQRHRFPLHAADQRGLTLSRIPCGQEFSSRFNSRDLFTKCQKRFFKRTSEFCRLICSIWIILIFHDFDDFSSNERSTQTIISNGTLQYYKNAIYLIKIWQVMYCDIIRLCDIWLKYNTTRIEAKSVPLLVIRFASPSTGRHLRAGDEKQKPTCCGTTWSLRLIQKKITRNLSCKRAWSGNASWQWHG